LFSLLTLTIGFAPVYAADVHVLDDGALANITGQDGLSFAINVNSNMGSLVLGTSDSAGNPATVALNNLSLTGSVGGTLDVFSSATGTPDYVNWAFPKFGTLNNLQFAADMLVTADGSSLGTAIQLQNMAFGGTNMQLSGAAGGGIAFGLGLNLTVSDLLLQPNGRGVNLGQMDFNNIVIGAAGSNGSKPWALADLNNQSGTFTVVTDSAGNESVQIGIGWATTPGTAPSGSLQIGNITFTTPNGNTNLGGSSIGAMQIQYLNVKLKTGS